MTGEDVFDHAFYDELLGCLYTLDSKLIDSVNGQWLGFRKYAETGGDPGIDEWIRCELQGVRFHQIRLIPLDFFHYFS